MEPELELELEPDREAELEPEPEPKAMPGLAVTSSNADNLARRFPHHSREQIDTVLERASGHAGRAAKELRHMDRYGAAALLGGVPLPLSASLGEDHRRTMSAAMNSAMICYTST